MTEDPGFETLRLTRSPVSVNVKIRVIPREISTSNRKHRTTRMNQNPSPIPLSPQEPPEVPKSSSHASRQATQPKRGFFKPEIVRRAAFCLISLCIVVSVISCILAIWEFAGSDALWRTVASCLVVAVGTTLFASANARFGEP